MILKEIFFILFSGGAGMAVGAAAAQAFGAGFAPEGAAGAGRAFG